VPDSEQIEQPNNESTYSNRDPGAPVDGTDGGAHVLSRMEVLQGLRMSVWEGGFSTVWGALTGGAFLTGFALSLHANSFAIGLLTAIPTFAGLVQVLSSYSGERLKTRKPLAGGSALIGRMLFLPILLLPIFIHVGAIIPFLFLFTASYVLLNISVPAWTSWMTDLVPADYRGRYFGRRNMILGVVGMVISLPAAWFLDYTTKQHHWANLGFGTLFGVAVVAALAAYACIQRQPEPPKTQAGTAQDDAGVAAAVAYFKAPFADPNFRRLMIFNTLFGTGQFFAAPFFTVYAIQVLKLNYVWLTIYATLTSISTLASMPLWGYLGDKFGNKPLLAIGVWGVFTLPIAWMWTSPQHGALTALLLVEINLIGGMFWAGVALTQFNLLIGFSPTGKTSIYVATMASVTGLAGGLAPMLGGVTMNALQNWHADAIGLHLANYHVTFLISALLRVAALPFLASVVDARAIETRAVLKQLGQARPRSWKQIRVLQHGDQEARLRATEALGGSRTRLAGDELQAALMDPSQAVREEAARALGEIGDSAAVDALIAALHDPAAGLVEEAAQALASIGDRKANAPLAALLRSGPDRITRRSRIVVAQALGRLGGADAVTALLHALSAAEDEELAEGVVDALGKTGSSRATPALTALIQRNDISFGLRRILVRAMGEIGDPKGIDPLLATLALYPSDGSMTPALADALARLDDGESALVLMHHLPELESQIARKQVAHAVGRLLGQGDLAYSLLSQDPMTRDGSIQKLLQDIHRNVTGPTPDRALKVAIKAHATGDIKACLRSLNRMARATQCDPETANRNESGILYHTLCQRFLEQVSAEFNGDIPAESLLIAFCALNGIGH